MNYSSIKTLYRPIKKFSLNSIFRFLISELHFTQVILKFVLMLSET